MTKIVVIGSIVMILTGLFLYIGLGDFKLKGFNEELHHNSEKYVTKFPLHLIIEVDDRRSLEGLTNCNYSSLHLIIALEPGISTSSSVWKDLKFSCSQLVTELSIRTSGNSTSTLEEIADLLQNFGWVKNLVIHFTHDFILPLEDLNQFSNIKQLSLKMDNHLNGFNNTWVKWVVSTFPQLEIFSSSFVMSVRELKGFSTLRFLKSLTASIAPEKNIQFIDFHFILGFKSRVDIRLNIKTTCDDNSDQKLIKISIFRSSPRHLNLNSLTITGKSTCNIKIATRLISKCSEYKYEREEGYDSILLSSCV